MDRLAFSFALFLLFWAPLPFGSQRPWAAYLLATCAALLLLMVSLSSQRADWQRLFGAKLFVVAYAVFPIVCLLQLLPLPFSGSGVTAEWFGGHTVSLSPYDTLMYLFKTASCLFIFISVVLLCDSRLRVVVFLAAVASAGVLQAAYGMFMTLSGLEYGFVIQKYAGVGRSTGTFVNANHFAAYCLICLSCLVGLLWAKTTERYQISAFRSGLDWLLVLKAAIGFLVAGVFLSNSRTASMLLLVMIAAGIGLHIYLRGRLSRRVMALLAAFFVIDVLLVGLGFGLGDVLSRFSHSEIGADGRFQVYIDSMALVPSYAWFGVGGGAFDTVFTAHNSVQPALRFMYLHNDVIQLLLEFGLLGVVAALMLVFMVIKWAVKVLKVRVSWQIHAAAYSALLIVTWLVLHSLVDFSMHISAIAFSVAAIAGVLCSAAQLPKRQKKLDS